jgi:translation initiation factor 1
MSRDRLVYSTDAGRVARRPPAAPAPPPAPAAGVARISVERAGRGGKTVTVIRGLAESGAALESLAGALRRLCGAGGAVKDGVIEVQGDHRERVAAQLRGLGRRVKLVGGAAR